MRRSPLPSLTSSYLPIIGAVGIELRRKFTFDHSIGRHTSPFLVDSSSPTDFASERACSQRSFPRVPTAERGPQADFLSAAAHCVGPTSSRTKSSRSGLHFAFTWLLMKNAFLELSQTCTARGFLRERAFTACRLLSTGSPPALGYCLRSDGHTTWPALNMFIPASVRCRAFEQSR